MSARITLVVWCEKEIELQVQFENGEFAISGLTEPDVRAIVHVLQAAKSQCLGRDAVFGPSTANLLLCIAGGIRQNHKELKLPSDSESFVLKAGSPQYLQMEQEFHSALERYFPHLATSEARNTKKYIKLRRNFFAPYTIVD